MKILGIEGMSPDRLRFEIQRGAKLVCYRYCISICRDDVPPGLQRLLHSRGRERRGQRVAPWTSLTLVAGWWGDSLGTDFHGPFPGDEFPERQRSHHRVERTPIAYGCGADRPRQSLKGQCRLPSFFA